MEDIYINTNAKMNHDWCIIYILNINIRIFLGFAVAEVRRWYRDPCGQYLFDSEKGERPLTCKDLPTPGPADYLPNYTACKPKRPEYSLRPMTKRGENRWRA